MLELGEKTVQWKCFRRAATKYKFLENVFFKNLLGSSGTHL